jgi:hypothetical protein
VNRINNDLSFPSSRLKWHSHGYFRVLSAMPGQEPMLAHKFFKGFSNSKLKYSSLMQLTLRNLQYTGTMLIGHFCEVLIRQLLNNVHNQSESRCLSYEPADSYRCNFIISSSLCFQLKKKCKNISKMLRPLKREFDWDLLVAAS